MFGPAAVLALPSNVVRHVESLDPGLFTARAPQPVKAPPRRDGTNPCSNSHHRTAAECRATTRRRARVYEATHERRHPVLVFRREYVAQPVGRVRLFVPPIADAIPAIIPDDGLGRQNAENVRRSDFRR